MCDVSINPRFIRSVLQKYLLCYGPSFDEGKHHPRVIMYDCTMVLTKGKKPLATFASSKAPILELKLRSVKLLALQQSTSIGTVAHPLDQLLARHGHELEMDEVQFRILFCFEHPTKLEWQLEMCMCVCVCVCGCVRVCERGQERGQERERTERELLIGFD